MHAVLVEFRSDGCDADDAMLLVLCLLVEDLFRQDEAVVHEGEVFLLREFRKLRGEVVDLQESQT